MNKKLSKLKLRKKSKFYRPLQGSTDQNWLPSYGPYDMAHNMDSISYGLMLEFWFFKETNLYLYWSCSYILYHRSKTNYKEKPIPGRKTLRLVKAWEKKCMQYASSMKNTRFWVRVSGTIGPVCPCFAWPWNDLAMTFDWSFSIFKKP